MDSMWYVVFGVYAVVMLAVGIWGYGRSKADRAEFSVAGRRLGPVLAAGTWIATFQSAVAVVGFTGYTSLYGYSFIGYLGVPVLIIGILFLVLAPRLQTTGFTTIPQLIEARYGSQLLRRLTSAFIIFFSGIAIVVQLLAAGIVLSGITGFSALGSIIAIGLLLTIYTSFGGLVSVVRTDNLQAILMFTGVIAVAVYLMYSVGPTLFTPINDDYDLFSGVVPDGWSIVGWTFVWAPGVMAQAFYLQRFYACRDVKTARLMAGSGAVLTALFYTLILVIGLGAARALPPDALGDSAYAEVLTQVLPTGLGIAAGVLVVAAIQSTVDSLLHIMGAYFTEDLYVPMRQVSDGHAATVSRLAVIVFGLGTTALAVYMSLSPIPLLSQLQSLAQGSMGAAIFVPIFAGLYWRRATLVGAIIGMVSGFAVTAGLYLMQSNGALDIDTQTPVHLGLAVGTITFILGSLASKPQYARHDSIRALGQTHNEGAESTPSAAN